MAVTAARHAVFAIAGHRWRADIEQFAARITIGIKAFLVLLVHGVSKRERQLVQRITRFIGSSARNVNRPPNEPVFSTFSGISILPARESTYATVVRAGSALDGTAANWLAVLP